MRKRAYVRKSLRATKKKVAKKKSLTVKNKLPKKRKIVVQKKSLSRKPRKLKRSSVKRTQAKKPVRKVQLKKRPQPKKVTRKAQPKKRTQPKKLTRKFSLKRRPQPKKQPRKVQPKKRALPKRRPQPKKQRKVQPKRRPQPRKPVRKVQPKKQVRKARKVQPKKPKKSSRVLFMERFHELRDEAVKSNKVDRPKDGYDKLVLLDHERYEGAKRTVFIGKPLSPKNTKSILETLDQTAQGMGGFLPTQRVWNAVFSILAYGRGKRLFGSSPIYLSEKKGEADRTLFQVQGFESTGITNTIPELLSLAKSKLHEALSEEGVFTWIEHITVWGFDYRSEQGRRRWRTASRKRRWAPR